MILTERDLYLTTASRASRELSPTRGPGTLRESHGGSIAGEFWNGRSPQKTWMRWGYHHDRSENLGKPPWPSGVWLWCLALRLIKAQCVETILFCPDRHNEHDAKEVKSAEITLDHTMGHSQSETQLTSNLNHSGAKSLWATHCLLVYWSFNSNYGNNDHFSCESL